MNLSPPFALDVCQQVRQRGRIAEKADMRIPGDDVFIGNAAFPRLFSCGFANLKDGFSGHVGHGFMEFMAGQPLAAFS